MLAIVEASSEHVLRAHRNIILGEFRDAQSAVKLFDVFTYFVDVALAWIVHEECSLDRLLFGEYATWLSTLSETVIDDPTRTLESRDGNFSGIGTQGLKRFKS